MKRNYPDASTAPATLLRRALVANVVFSAGSAAILVANANSLASHLALSTREIVGLGVQLGVFAALLILLATRPRVERRWVLVAAELVALADFGWAAGSLIGLFRGLAWTTTGLVLCSLGIVGTATLGSLQALAIVGIRRREAEAPAAAKPARAFTQHLRRAVGLATAIAILFGLLYILLPWADLRAEAIRRPGALDIESSAAADGRELLAMVANAHGVAALRAHRTMEVVAVDEWAGSSPWWPQPTQRFRAERLLGTFTSRVELLDGPGAGEIRGIQSWRPYRRTAATAPLRSPARDSMITFYLPTLQYFDELPFRLLEATLALDAGTATIAGRPYRRLFVTWGDAAPHAAADQYELLIDPETLRVAKASYTVRDGVDASPLWMRPLMKIAAVGTMHYEDYRQVDGVMVPFRQTVTLGSAESTPGSVEEEFFHRLLVESVRFDSVDPTVLMPLEGLPEPGDRKPR